MNVSSDLGAIARVQSFRNMAVRALGRGPASSVSNLEFQNLALQGGPFEEITSQVGPLWVMADDAEMRPYIRDQGNWQQATLNLLGSLIRPGCRFLDIGAGYGYYSLVAAQCAPDVRIHAVEPDPERFALLRANFWAHGIAARTENVALGAERRMKALSPRPKGRAAVRRSANSACSARHSCLWSSPTAFFAAALSTWFGSKLRDGSQTSSQACRGSSGTLLEL